MQIADLSKDEVEALNNISKTKGVTRLANPDFGVSLGFPDQP